MSNIRRLVTIVTVVLTCGTLLIFGGKSSQALRSQSYTSKQSPPAINDPLSDNSQGNEWDVDSGCQFSDDAYQASIDKENTIGTCLSKKRSFRNFVFGVEKMKIVTGDCGGLVFRSDPTTGSEYVFEVCQDGSYALYGKKNTSSSYSKLTGGTSSSIHTGLGQTNLVAIAAKENQLVFFINDTKNPVGRISDDTSSQGLIGVVASSFNNPTTVTYTHAVAVADDMSVP